MIARRLSIGYAFGLCRRGPASNEWERLMGLIYCPDCKNQVSDRAAACPGCGSPLPQGGAASAVPAQAAMESCRHCGVPYQRGLRTCPQCGKGTVTVGKAYGTLDLRKGGFGLFDLIPGIRDLPAIAKIILIAAVVVLVTLFVLPALR